MNRSSLTAMVAAVSCALSSFTVVAANGASADAYPSRPIRLIAPFPPGGSNDTIARYMGLKMGDLLGMQFVVENRAGASGTIGTDVASQSEPDGYTLCMASTTFVMVPAARKVPYDVEKSFSPVGMIAGGPNSIVVNPSFNVRNLRGLVELAKKRPGEVLYASTGTAGFNHFGGELFKRHVGINMVHVPYKGGGPAMIDVMAGQVPVMFSSVTQVFPHVRTGKLKVLAVGGDKRTPALPDVPTVAEAGYPGYKVSIWWGMIAPAGVPPAIINKLNSTINAVLKTPEAKKRFALDAAEVLPGKPADFGRTISDELRRWTEVAKAAGISSK